LNPGIDSQVDIGAGRWLDPVLFVPDLVLCAFLQYAFTRLTAENLVHRVFEIIPALFVGLIIVEIPEVRKLADIFGSPNVSEDLSGERTIRIKTHGG
jgi:hypothetical protein